MFSKEFAPWGQRNENIIITSIIITVNTWKVLSYRREKRFDPVIDIGHVPL